MKVLMQNRFDAFQKIGGDTIQMLKTKEYLERLGVQVDISLELEPNVEKYDIVHVFNLVRPQETYFQVKNAKLADKPVAFSTIYWDFKEYNLQRNSKAKILYKFLKEETVENLKSVARATSPQVPKKIKRYFWKSYLKTFKEQQRYLLENVDILLPNSQMEYQLINDNFRFGNKKWKAIPNAVDAEWLKLNQTTDIDNIKVPFDSYVLCVGRFDERKNQLMLLKALLGSNIPLVLIGNSIRTHRNYFKEIKSIANLKGNCMILQHQDQESLIYYYKKAKVHALVSWLETPGLASLEAGIFDTNLVATRKGCTYEYFGDSVWYCEPNNVDSIKRSVENAFYSPLNHDIKNKILKNFTWNIAAKKTLEAYNEILD